MGGRIEELRAQGEARRAVILQWIRDYWSSEGIAPTLREIARGCGLESQTTAHHHVAILVDEGLLTHVPGIPRSLRVVEQP